MGLTVKYSQKCGMKVNFLNLQKQVPVPPGKIKKLIRKILRTERPRASGWINLCFVDNPGIKKFNAKFLKHPGSTDVLAFNLGSKKEKNIILADIMISAQKAKE
jgi:ssRNA-specific RNase YbeY (16S rRNA maturation enzyme)